MVKENVDNAHLIRLAQRFAQRVKPLGAANSVPADGRVMRLAYQPAPR